MLEFLSENGDQLVEFGLVTLRLSLTSFAIAMVVGVIIAACRVSPVPPLRKFAAGFVATFRNTPLLVVFFLAYFGLGELQLIFEPFPTAAWALGLYTGAYMAEVLRSGINSVSSGQAEAGRAIGLNFFQLLGYVVVPQAMRTVIGPIGNLFIANAKNTAVALTIGVSELTALSGRLINETAQTWLSLLSVAAIYTISLLFAGWAFRALENRYAIKR